MKNIFIALAIAATAAGNAGAQAGGYSLTQACEYAKQHAFAVQNARHDENVAGISTDKLIGIGLPQVNASVSYQNFIQLPTSIIPGEIFGAPGEDVRVQFGTSQNLTAGIGVSQLLFDGSWLVGLEASRAYADLKSKQVQLSETEQKEAVTNAYHLVLIAERNVALLEDSRVVMQKMLDETSALYAQGMVEEQSVDEFKLALSDLDNRIGYGKSQTEIAYDLLKLQMGYPQQDDIQLTDNLDIFLTGADAQLLTTAFVADNRMEMQVQQGALNMQQLNLKNQKAKLLPSVGAFYNLQTQALRNEFNFADGSEPWFPTQVWGIQMNVPIFTGRSNAKGIEEAKVEVQRMNDLMTFTREQLLLDYFNARSGYEFALENYAWAEENLSLSQKVYDKTLVKFKEGLAGSFEVSENQRRIISAQGAYINSALQLLQARTKLQRALNQI